MKIKSTLTVLIDNDEEKFFKIQNHYVRNATINISENNQKEKGQTKFSAFLNRDEREEMTMQKRIESKVSTSLKK